MALLPLHIGQMIHPPKTCISAWPQNAPSGHRRHYFTSPNCIYSSLQVKNLRSFPDIFLKYMPTFSFNHLKFKKKKSKNFPLVLFYAVKNYQKCIWFRTRRATVDIISSISQIWRKRLLENHFLCAFFDSQQVRLVKRANRNHWAAEFLVVLLPQQDASTELFTLDCWFLFQSFQAMRGFQDF